MSLWQFGNEYDGLLIVSATSEVEARAKRDQWLMDQERMDAAYRAWWQAAQNPQRDYWDRRRGFGADGQRRAEQELGPMPQGGIVHFDKVRTDEPRQIGETFHYIWME